MTSTSSNRRRQLLWIAAAVLAVVIGGGLWAFQPWRLFTSSTVNEELPAATAPPPPADGGADRAEGEDSRAEDAAPEPRVLAEGEFVSQEHETSGTAKVVELADGRRVVRLENLASSDGPDLKVWLTDQEAGGDWYKYDDGTYVALGALKGTHGNANYEIPAGADIEDMTSVVIWCERFSVAFGSAPVAL
ncbi:DM13 domain-containing protein [Nocardiopsis rhodophaea]|uniref:DM13 domain-containing protein n=1 Tax=Nocardiopsis rhodophaea TaxID=280238 RepID=A0ABP5ELV8_9ACTN